MHLAHACINLISFYHFVRRFFLLNFLFPYYASKNLLNFKILTAFSLEALLLNSVTTQFYFFIITPSYSIISIDFA